jgi:Yeast cortical protein KAR9
MPATTKVLSIIDKGVQDRVTKNGECLRRHADSTQRWKHLRERITRTDAEMEAVRRILTGEEDMITPSDSGSVASGPTSKSKSRNGYLTPPSATSSKKSLSLSASSALSRSVSPFRKFARRITGGGKSPMAGQQPSEPTGTLRHRTSLFQFSIGQPTSPTTSGHKYTQSLTPDSSPSTRRVDQDPNITIKGKSTPSSKQPWNSSTRVDEDPRVRRPSVVSPHRPAGIQPPLPLPPGSSPSGRSVSRSSMASSRPWSPIMSSVSTAASTNPTHPQRPPSRSQTPNVNLTSPRGRPKTPSNIPTPSRSHLRAFSDTQWDEDDPSTSLMQRALSPDPTTPPRATTPGGTRLPGPRPPSRSMIPAPVFHILSPSRPGSTLSHYNGSGRESPAHSHASFRASALRAQTPEATLRLRAQAVPFYGSISAGSGSTGNNSPRVIRPSINTKLPPSSFRDTSSLTSSTSAQRTPSRPSSRLSDLGGGIAGMGGSVSPTYLYTPGNPRDPLDAEVAAIVNSIAHGLLIERVDPPLKKIPREGEEVRAQYAFSNSLARKTVTCRLTTLSRAGAKGEPSTATKKVMVRVGGGKLFSLY